jgi:hypothetical protein
MHGAMPEDSTACHSFESGPLAISLNDLGGCSICVDSCATLIGHQEFAKTQPNMAISLVGGVPTLIGLPVVASINKRDLVAAAMEKQVLWNLSVELRSEPALCASSININIGNTNNDLESPTNYLSNTFLFVRGQRRERTSAEREDIYLVSYKLYFLRLVFNIRAFRIGGRETDHTLQHSTAIQG